MADLRQGIQELRDLLGPHAPLQRDLSEALSELSEAARSLGTLAEFLNRHPNALLTGRKASDTKP
jgi:paraquat-inducible protein B